MSFITSIGTANPKHRFEQGVIAGFMARAMQLNAEEERRLLALYRATGIETRYSVIGDYGKTDLFEFYPDNKLLEPFPNTKLRMELFQREAIILSLEAVRNCLNDHINTSEITHLIVASCTGLYAPGLDIDLVKALGLNTSVKRTCINFMGCYAAFNAIKLGHSFCSQHSSAKVLIVCTEICSLHFQKENTEDNWLANALFADGSAAVLMESVSMASKKISPINFYCDLALNAEKDMAWTVGDFGFEMKLSTYVPQAIKSGIAALTERLLERVIPLSDISFYAIHPGGKRILDVIQAELKLSPSHLSYSYHVLRNFGNMSSPTVLFVLKEIFESVQADDHQKQILSFAFGPGLTLESMLLQLKFN